MAWTYLALTWWQWVVVGIVVLTQVPAALANGSLAGLVGVTIAVYTIVWLLAAASRKLRGTSSDEPAAEGADV